MLTANSPSPAHVMTVEEAVRLLCESTYHVPSLPDEPPNIWSVRARDILNVQKDKKREAAAYLCDEYPHLPHEERERIAEALFHDVYPPSDNVTANRWRGQQFYALHVAFHGLDAPAEIISFFHTRLIPSVVKYLTVGNVSEWPVTTYREIFAYRQFPASLLEEAFAGEKERIAAGMRDRKATDNIFPYYTSATFAAITANPNCPASILAWGAEHEDKEIVEAVAGNLGAADEYRVYAQLRLMSWTEEVT